jgi:branched-chain amino acid transport system permease protein
MRAFSDRKTLLAAIVFIAAIVIYPVLAPDSYHLGIGITAGAMAASTVGVVLLLGLAHQLAIGQAAFSMIGGYATALLCVNYGWDPFPAMLLGIVLTMLVAYAVAAPLLKLRGFVLVMATLALHLMLIVVASQVEFTGGPIGVTGVPKLAVFGWQIGSELGFYYFSWAVALLAVAIGLNIDRSRIGRALRAIAESEMAAGSVGIDITRYKVQMFVIGAGMASVSGSLLVHYLRAMDPTVFGFNYSLNLVTGTIVGGLLSIWGGALGAVIIIGLRELLRDLSLPLWEAVIMGGLTVVVLIAFPRGIAGFISDLFDRLAGGQGARRAVGVPPDPTALPPVGASAAAGPLLELTDVTRHFGSLRAVEQVSFTVREGAIAALIGPNGAGKTTLFNLICGHQPLLAGRIQFTGRDIQTLLPRDIAMLGIGRTFQNLQLFDNMTVLENVMCGRHRLTRTGIFAVALRLPFVRREEQATRIAAEDCLRFVGLQGATELRPSELSFGHQRLVEIARALALRPRLLLMDEPASGLNDTETETLAELVLRIVAIGVTVLLVEHDMRIVMGLADHVVVMDHGEKMAEGPPDLVRADPKVIGAYLGQEAARVA